GPLHLRHHPDESEVVPFRQKSSLLRIRGREFLFCSQTLLLESLQIVREIREPLLLLHFRRWAAAVEGPKRGSPHRNILRAVRWLFHSKLQHGIDVRFRELAAVVSGKLRQI